MPLCCQSDRGARPRRPPIVEHADQVTRNRIKKVAERLPLPPNARRVEDPEVGMSREGRRTREFRGRKDVTFAMAGQQRRGWPFARHQRRENDPGPETVVRVGTKPSTEC